MKNVFFKYYKVIKFKNTNIKNTYLIKLIFVALCLLKKLCLVELFCYLNNQQLIFQHP